MEAARYPWDKSSGDDGHPQPRYGSLTIEGSSHRDYAVHELTRDRSLLVRVTLSHWISSAHTLEITEQNIFAGHHTLYTQRPVRAPVPRWCRSRRVCLQRHLLLDRPYHKSDTTYKRKILSLQPYLGHEFPNRSLSNV